jgi:pseudaminic acid synthase
VDRRVVVGDRAIGTGCPAYIIAELSANHGQDYDQAVRIVEAAARAGADAVKLQTYTPDTMTIDSDRPEFIISGTMWDGRRLYELYEEAYTPWEWQPRLKRAAESLGLHFFSTPFDATSVEFLEEMGVPAYKIASFENVDLPLLRRVAATGKPIIMSTGMATLAEIDEAVRTLRDAGCEQLILLKCSSAYPAPAGEMNLRTIPHLADAFDLPVGLSDHTLDIAVPVTAVALGACVVEKHLTLSRAVPGPDSAFSLEPDEFADMVRVVRSAEQALGAVHYGVSPRELASRAFRRSLFVVRNVAEGETFTEENVRAIRPGHGLHTRHLQDVLGRRAARTVDRGTPLSWELTDR